MAQQQPRRPPPSTARPRTPAEEVEEGSDTEAVVKHYEKSQAFRGRFAPKDPGEFRIRILPPPQRGLFFREFGRHYGLKDAGIKSGERFSAICLRLTLGQECPLCDFSDTLRFDAKRSDGSVDEGLQKIASSIRPAKRVVMNVLNLKDPSAGVLTWELGFKQYEKIAPLVQEFGDITNSAKGRDLRVIFSKQGEWCTPQTIFATDPCPIDSAKFPDWRTGRKNLQAYAEADLVSQDEMRTLIATSRLAETSGVGAVAPKAAAVAHPAEVAGEADDGEGTWDDDTATDITDEANQLAKDLQGDGEEAVDEEERKALEVLERAKARRAAAAGK